MLAAQLGRGGAAIGTFFEPGLGTITTAAALGAMVGGLIGYAAAGAAAGYLYDWAEGTVFTPAPEAAVPPDERPRLARSRASAGLPSPLFGAGHDGGVGVTSGFLR